MSIFILGDVNYKHIINKLISRNYISLTINWAIGTKVGTFGIRPWLFDSGGHNYYIDKKDRIKSIELSKTLLETDTDIDIMFRLCLFGILGRNLTKPVDKIVVPDLNNELHNNISKVASKLNIPFTTLFELNEKGAVAPSGNNSPYHLFFEGDYNDIYYKHIQS